MQRKSCFNQLLMLAGALLFVTLCTGLGGFAGLKAMVALAESGREDWVDIAPPGVPVADVQVAGVNDPYHYAYVVMLLTQDGRLLSSGILERPVEDWSWIDISDRQAWTEIPHFALGPDLDDRYILWIEHEGQQYRLSTAGEWLMREADPTSPLLNPPENAAEREGDCSDNPGWRPPPGEMRSIRCAVVGHWESPSNLTFVQLEGQPGVWFLTSTQGYADVLGEAGGVLTGIMLGFGLGCTLVLLWIVFRNPKNRIKPG